jgi:hypothetical protein
MKAGFLTPGVKRADLEEKRRKEMAKRNKVTITEETEIQGRKALFCTLWSLHGRNAFPDTLRGAYIKMLKTDFPSSKKVLTQKELTALNNPEDVLKKVMVFDKNLSMFEMIVERYDRLSPKALRLLKMPEFSDDDRKKIQEMKEQKYTSVTVADDWIIQEVVQIFGEKTRIVVSRRAARVMKAKIREKDVKKETWGSLEEDVKRHFKDIVDSLQDVTVAVAAPCKFQVGIEFDWINNTAEISSDLSEWDEADGKPGDRQGVKASALDFISNLLKLKGKNTFTSLDIQGEMKDPGLRNKLEKVNVKDHLIVIRGGLYHLVGNATENEESVKAILRLFSMPKVQDAAEGFFAEKGTFEGFFEIRKEFDRNHTRIQGIALKNEDPLDCSGIYLKVFGSNEKGPDLYKGTKLEGKKIEAVSFEYQHGSGEWIIKTPDYSRRVHDAFIAELNVLSRKPSKHPKPKN